MKKKRIVLLQWPNQSPGLNRLKCWGRILRELCTMQSPQTSISLSNVVKKSGTKFHNGLRGWWSQYLKKTLQVQKKKFLWKKMLLLLKVLWVYLAFHRAAAKTALKTIFFRWLYRSVQKVNNITVITMSSCFFPVAIHYNKLSSTVSSCDRLADLSARWKLGACCLNCISLHTVIRCFVNPPPPQLLHFVSFLTWYTA